MTVVDTRKQTTPPALIMNSPEHRTIVQCTPHLTKALKIHLELVTLSGELHAAGLIAEDNATALASHFINPAERAAQLVGLVRNKISLNIENYHSFIKVLKQRQDAHKDILKILVEKYEEIIMNDGESIRLTCEGIYTCTRARLLAWRNT